MKSEKTSFRLPRVRVSPFASVVLLFASIKTAVHLLTAVNYGYFCDELYTIALSKHLDFGYMDLPPIVPALVALTRALLGESLFAFRIVPAFAGAGTLVFVCLITRELGGKLFAVSVAGLGALIVPIWLTVDSFFCYDSIDQFLLSAFIWLLVRFVRTGNAKLWPLLGLAAGIACMTKTTVLYLGPGLVAALLFSKHRRQLLSPLLWLGFTVFLAAISPYVVWNSLHDWVSLEHWSHYASASVYEYSVPEFFLNIFLTMNPLLCPLLILGLYRTFRPFDGVRYHFFGVMFLVTAILVCLLHGRIFMLVELFSPLIAAGAVAVEEKLSARGGGRAAKAAVLAWLAAGGLLVLPASVPLLPVDALPAYAKTFSFLWRPVKDFNFLKSDFPQEFSNRIGWEELVAEVAKVYDELPPEDRRKAGIWGDWYGPAGAVDLFGPKYGLPHAVSGHNHYWLWGPGYSWEVMILVSSNGLALSRFFREMTAVKVIDNPYAMPWNRLVVYVARKPRMPPDVIFWYLRNW